jgi:hypothetical protein
MVPYVRGRTPWAVVLCRFPDIPEPAWPISHVRNFFTESGAGRGSLFDYWRDISQGTIDLTGSVVTPWYTMQYSYRENWRGRRGLWINEAIRLAQNDLPLFDYVGLVAVLNAPVEDSALGKVMQTIQGRTREYGLLALNTSEAMGQSNWRHCRNCQGIFFAGNHDQGRCPVDPNRERQHQPSEAQTNYLMTDGPGRLPDPSESGWRWCTNCEGLWYEPGEPAPCPRGGTHVSAGSAPYELVYDLPGFPYQPGFRRCRRCRGLAHSASTGACSAGGGHDYTGSPDYTMLRNESHIEVMMGGHEMAHGYGLGHSFRSASPDVEYGDPWDLMSATLVKWFDSGLTGGEYGVSGPGLCAPTLMQLGWLPEGRVSTERGTTTLSPLNRPDLPGPLALRTQASGRIYTVELRVPSAWDMGILQPSLLIHELRTSYSVGQKGWRWCRNCEILFYAGAAACAGGGVHDVAGSGEYTLTLNDAGASGERGWRWCRKCQGLVLDEGYPDTCAAGRGHDVSSSGEYVLALDALRASGQRNWHRCQKCHGLVHASSLPASCARGGVHELGSAEYTLPLNDPHALGQRNWRWCAKCRGLFYWGAAKCVPAGTLHDHTGSAHYALALDVASEPAGQRGWRWCRKCLGIVFAPSLPATCARGGDHDITRSGEYILPVGSPSTPGQRQWRWCRNCKASAFAAGRCPVGGGAHLFNPEGDYALANFGDDHPYIIPASQARYDWQAGTTFTDPGRGVRIAIDAVNATNARVTITAP